MSERERPDASGAAPATSRHIEWEFRMSLNCEHTTLGQRVLFGAGRAGANLAAEVARLGARRVMAIASASEAGGSPTSRRH
jgi:hypothetical protein